MVIHQIVKIYNIIIQNITYLYKNSNTVFSKNTKSHNFILIISDTLWTSCFTIAELT